MLNIICNNRNKSHIYVCRLALHPQKRSTFRKIVGTVRTERCFLTSAFNKVFSLKWGLEVPFRSWSFSVEFCSHQQTLLMLQHHLTRGVALRLHCTLSNCVSTQQYIELVQIHKTTAEPGLCITFSKTIFISVLCAISMLCTSKHTEQSSLYFSCRQNVKVGHFLS